MSLLNPTTENQAYEELDGFNLVLDAVSIGSVTIYRLYKEIDDLEDEDETLEFTDLQEAWNAFHRVIGRNYF